MEDGPDSLEARVAGLAEPARRLTGHAGRKQDVELLENGPQLSAAGFAQLQGREVVSMRHGASELDALAQTLADALAVVHPLVRHSRRALVVVDGLPRRVAQPGELLGQCHAGDLRPGLGKPLGRILEGGHGFRLGRAPQWRAAEPDTRSALQRLEGGGRTQLEHRAQEVDVIEGAGDQPDGVQAFRRGIDAFAVEGAEGGLETEHAAIGCGAEHRAPGLGAERDRHHPVRNRCARSARGPAGGMGAVVRIGRGPRCHAGELAGHGLPQDHRAGGANQGHAGGVCRRAVAAINRRAHLGRQVGGVDDVLHPDRYSGKGQLPGLRPDAIERPGLCEGELRVDACPGVDLALARIDTREAIAHDRLAGGLAGCDGAHDLGRGEPVERDSVARARLGDGRDAHACTQFLPARAAEVPAMRPKTAPEVRPEPPG